MGGTPVPGARRTGRQAAATLRRDPATPSPRPGVRSASSWRPWRCPRWGLRDRPRPRPSTQRVRVPPMAGRAPTPSSRRASRRALREPARTARLRAPLHPASLGSLAGAGFNEVRFAGGTWDFGGNRAAALVVFQATGPDGRSGGRLLRHQRSCGEPTTVTGESTRQSGADPATGSTRRPAVGQQTVVDLAAADAGGRQHRHHQRPAGPEDRRGGRRPSAGIDGDDPVLESAP